MGEFGGDRDVKRSIFWMSVIPFFFTICMYNMHCSTSSLPGLFLATAVCHHTPRDKLLMIFLTKST